MLRDLLRRSAPPRELPPGDPIDATIAAALAARLRSTDVWRLPVVVGIRTLVADVCAMLPMAALRGVDRLDPQPGIVRRPDPNEPYRSTIEKTVHSLTRYGNAFLRRWQFNAEGHPLAVTVWRPADVVVLTNDWGDRIVGFEHQGRRYSPSTVLHIPFITDPGPVGKSPIDEIATVVDDLCTLYEWAAGYWRDGGTPPYALTHQAKMDDAQAKGVLDRWLANRAARRPSLLSGGWGLQTFSMPTAADALLIDGLNYLDAAVARALNVPPSLANVVSQQSLTYSTTTDELRRWLTLNLYPTYLARLEAAFTDLLPRGQSAAFDTSNLLRTDWPTRVSTSAAAVAAGLMTVDEARVSQLGLPPIGDGPQLEPIGTPSIEGV